jgi:hypothetical protein
MAIWCRPQQRNVLRISCAWYFLLILIKFEISRQTFIKVPKYQISRKSVRWRDGQTDCRPDALTAWYYFSRKERFDSDLISPIATKHTHGFTWSARFLPDLIQIWNFSTNFHKNPEYQISQESVQWELHCYTRTDRQTDMTKLKNHFLRLCEGG